MKKFILIIAIVFSGILIQAQMTTYTNVQSANSISGKTGVYSNSSFDWTIRAHKNNVYEIYTPTLGSLLVKFSRMVDGKYAYLPYDSKFYDNNIVRSVMSTHKLSSLTVGKTNGTTPIFGILFRDYGVYYKLK